MSNVRENIYENENIFQCSLKNIKSDKTKVKDVFFKLAPLLDPYKYLIGKYDINNKNLFCLPSFIENQCNQTSSIVHPKILDMNNSAYVDGLFVFLSSQLIYTYNFIHSVDYYGSFLAIKNNYKMNVFDDIDYLNNSDFFNKQKNKLFKIDKYDYLFQTTEIKKNPIHIQNNVSLKSDISVYSIKEEIFDNLFSENKNCIHLNDLKDLSIDLIDITEDNLFLDTNNIETTTLKSGSTCSSRSSHTSSNLSNQISNCNDCNKVEEIINNNEESSEWEDDSNHDEEEEKIDVIIPRFPVQVICMENCDLTLDQLILENELKEEEWFSIFMQIIMILITFQQTFSFTHNDLHTNNVMYNETMQKYIYYCYKNKYYKVPTFGKLFKIIDFGRSIYKYNGQIFCSDSFQNGGDAATQYNIEPYFNEKKPRLEPNFSFDLCRLACSIFDHIIEDISTIQNLNILDPVRKIIVEWCLDDKGVNLLYKKNGADRYPDFKLYKMISRSVHNHVPHTQLDRSEFKKYIISKDSLSKNENIINIDNIPILV